MEETLFQLCRSDDVAVMPKLIFLGGGNMATALVDGAVTKGFVTKDQIIVTARTEETLAKWRRKGYTNLSTNNREVLEAYPYAIVFLAVKPQSRFQLFQEIRDCGNVYVSLMAGISLAILAKELEIDNRERLLRLHPNIASSIGAGTSILSANPGSPTVIVQIVRSFASCTGICLPVDEETFDAAGTLAGCIPAWAFTMIEALSDGGVLAGVPRGLSTQLTAQAVMGAAKLVLETGEHPGVLKDKVCSPGGTTIAGIRQLENRGIRSGFIEAVKAATDRAKEMGKKNKD